MASPTQFQIFFDNNQNYNPNKYPTSLKLIDNNNNKYQNFSLFNHKNNIPKNDVISLLTTRNYEYKNINPIINPSPVDNTNKVNYNKQIFSNDYKKIYSFEQNYPNKNSKGMQRYNSYENYNLFNLSNNGSVTQDKKETNNTFNEIRHCNTNYIIPKNESKTKISKIPHPKILTKKIHHHNPINRCQTEYRYNYTNFNTQNYSNQNNLNNYSGYNIINGENNLTTKYLNTSTNKELYMDNINGIFDVEEPNTNFKLSDFIILRQIGEGSEGSINAVKWKKNNKTYVLKKSEIIHDEDAELKKKLNIFLKNLIGETGCEGIIKIYGHLCSNNHFGTYYFYELMEKADRNWEQEISNRRKKHLYYQEYELMNIFRDLIKTFSLLQSRYFTHRDIKPENIMIVNEKLKICDFGNAKLIKNDGVIVQKIRGSELFLSPIAFKGLHSGMPTIRHNTFKSDVFSLGMCFLLAATLSYEELNIIREVYDMNIIKRVINKSLGKRYSHKITNLLINMLQIEENNRPDFEQLEIILMYS